MGRARRRRRRPQSAARALPAQPGAREPLQPVVAALPQRALHRRRGDRRFRASAPAARPQCARRRSSRALAALRARRAGRLRRASRRSSCDGARAACTRTSAQRHLARTTRARARVPRVPARRRRPRCAGTRCSRRCRSTSIAPTPRCGAGRSGRESYRDPASRRGRRLRATRSSSASSSTSTCSGRPTRSSRARGAARARARACGVGLYHDLAVSVDRGGAEAWANQDLYAVGASVGAPPDEFNLEGPGLGPAAARPGAAARGRLRAVHRDAARQHAPRRRAAHRPRDGPDAAVLDAAERRGARTARTCAIRSTTCSAILALESQRNRCMVIGEDLGTVPDEVRDGARARAACCRTGCSSSSATRAATSSRRPRIPREALVAVSTHDLPTLAGCWDGRDLEVRARARAAARRSERASGSSSSARRTARGCSLALERERLLPPGATADPRRAGR